MSIEKLLVKFMLSLSGDYDQSNLTLAAEKNKGTTKSMTFFLLRIYLHMIG